MVTTFGQGAYNFHKGTITKKDGSVIQCYVQTAGTYYAWVPYKMTEQGEELSFKSKEVKSIKTKNEYFESIDLDGKERLMALVADGKAKLFVYLIQNSNYAPPTILRVLKVGDEAVELTKKNFKTILTSKLGDQPTIVEKINRADVELVDVFEIIDEYNARVALIQAGGSVDLPKPVNPTDKETKLVIAGSTDSSPMKKVKIGKNIPIISGPEPFKEEYYVLKSDESIRHGTYVKYRPAKGGVLVLESGMYQNGEKNGLWESFYESSTASSSIKEKGVYVNGKKNGVWTSFYRDSIPEIIVQEKYSANRQVDSISLSINQQSAIVKMVGMYLNDKRVGEWRSFTRSGEVIQHYNFSKKVLIQDNSLSDSVINHTNRKALFIGGAPLLLDFLQLEFRLSGEIMTAIEEDSSSFDVSFTIDKDGLMKDEKVELSTGPKEFEDEAVAVVKRTATRWIPAVREGQPIESNFKIHFLIVKKKTSENFTRFQVRFTPLVD